MRSYLLAFFGVLVLFVFEARYGLFAWSLALLLPGVALLVHPPRQSPGIWIDRCALGFLAALLLAFVPQFYWPTPEWRVTAHEVFQVPLPLSLTVQPRRSFELWLSAFAGFAWFYAAYSWSINYNGRKWFYLVLSLVLAGLAGMVIYAHLAGAGDSGIENRGFIGFLFNRNQVLSVLLMGGVAAFGFMIHGFRARQFVSLAGFACAGLCFLALFSGTYQTGILFFCLGIILLYSMHLRVVDLPGRLKLFFPLILAAFSLFVISSSGFSERLLAFVAHPDSWGEHPQLQILRDILAMVKDVPLTGHGLGNFQAVAPQYHEFSLAHQSVLQPGSDVLWLLAETGVLGLGTLLAFTIALLLRCRDLGRGPSGSYRMAALAAVLCFLLLGFTESSGHYSGTAYLAILLAAVALPRPKSPVPSISPRIWRLVGGVLVLCSLLYGLSGLTGLPLYSSLAVARYEKKIQSHIEEGRYESALDKLNAWVGLRPLDWRAYSQRASLQLAHLGEKSKAKADFERARFVEPKLGTVVLEEGFAWMPYDRANALAAWKEVFQREFEDRESAFQQMLEAARDNPSIREGLGRISELDLDFRLLFLSEQPRSNFMQELAYDLERDPKLGHFSQAQRTALVMEWISRGDRQAVETFLRQNESGLRNPWWLWSFLRKEQARFEEAVQYIRAGLPMPELPETNLGEVPRQSLEREFSVSPSEVMKGTELLKIYLAEGNYERIKEVTERMSATQRQMPSYITFLQAESYYQLKDYIESWYFFETYLKAKGGLQ